MKKTLLFFVVLLVSTLSVDAQKYIAVKDSSAKWCFVDGKGKTYLENRFDCELTSVVNGFFKTKKTDGTYALYAFDKKKPRLIIDNLLNAGNFSEGCIPICRKNKPIEIIDKGGKVVLTLDSIDGKLVCECSDCRYGCFVVTVIDEDCNRFQGAVDIKGNVVIKPDYGIVRIFGKNRYAYCTKGDKQGLQEYFLSDGKSVSRHIQTRDFHCLNMKDGYLVVYEDSLSMIVNPKNMKPLITFPTKKTVYGIYDNLISLRNGQEKVSVVDFKNGEIIPETALLDYSYANICFADNGIIAGESGEYRIYSRRGEYKGTRVFDDIGRRFNTIIGKIGKDFCILDNNFNPVFTASYIPYLYEGFDYDDASNSLLWRNNYDNEVLARIMANLLNNKYIKSNTIPGKYAVESGIFNPNAIKEDFSPNNDDDWWTLNDVMICKANTDMYENYRIGEVTITLKNMELDDARAVESRVTAMLTDGGYRKDDNGYWRNEITGVAVFVCDDEEHVGKYALTMALE